MKFLVSLMLLIICSGCAAGFGNTVPLKDVITIEDPAPGRVQFGERWVRVDAFSDARQQERIITINGRPVVPADALSRYVTDAFQDILRMNDYRIAQNHGPILRGEIVEWEADVKTGFPTSSEYAKATVRVAIIDDSGKVLYSAVYNGTSSTKHPFLTESKVKDILGEAMRAALEGVLKDSTFMQIVATASSESASQNSNSMNKLSERSYDSYNGQAYNNANSFQNNGTVQPKFQDNTINSDTYRNDSYQGSFNNRENLDLLNMNN